jgi:hypothetical protein
LKSRRNDARYPGSVTIHYPLHPFYGQEFPVARGFGTDNALQFELQADDRRVLVPAWMTDVDRCRQLTADGDLHASMFALLELVDLVQKADL